MSKLPLFFVAPIATGTILFAAAPSASADPLPLTPVASVQENQAAIAALGSNVGTAVTVGSLGGTIAGAAVGCGIGAVVVPAVGCIPGAVTGAGIGAVAGTIVAGGPTLVVMGVETVNTLNAAPGTTKWAE
jgi:hypothetical protein